MFQLRIEHEEALKRSAVKRFEARLLEHLWEHFPLAYQRLGTEQMRAVLRYGIERATRYGFVTEIHVCRYVSLMFRLGSDFDTDPQLAWASRVLSDPTHSGPLSRMRDLYAEALHYIDRTAGSNNQHWAFAQPMLRQGAVEEFSLSGHGGLEQQICDLLDLVNGRKYDVLGETAVRRLIRQGADAASGYGMAHPQGVANYVMLMFMLGSGFERDPQFPWASALLTQHIDPIAKARQLAGAALEHVEAEFPNSSERTQLLASEDNRYVHI